MALSKKIIASGLAVLALVATTAAASAASAYATSNVNVRSGPSTHYRVVDTLRRGEQVDVQQCRSGWCFVEKRGADGWVSANYLSRSGHGGWNDRDRDRDRWERTPRWTPQPERPRRYDPRPQRPTYPRHNNNSQVCVNGPNGYFCIGN
jgi:hypothetical protein